MERISNKNPCLNCCSDRQIGNPDVWQSDCYRCEKLPNWKAKAINRLFDIEDILGDEYDLEHLKDLVEADREGRCVVLPCKLHDKVFFVENGCVKETEVDSFHNWTSGHWKISTHTDRMFDHWKGYEIDFSGINKTVFLTREEAEAALEKMKGGNE